MSQPGPAAELAELLARFDEDAWVAIANRGLLRRARKDLESLPVSLVDPPPDAARAEVEVAVGDRIVRFGGSGPADATCSCPSTTLCQHIITAGLWLAASAADTTGVKRALDGDAVDAASGLHAELMGLDAAALTAYAGLPGYRWAHQLLDDADSPPALSREGYLSVGFASPSLTVRYLGGGVDALMLDQQVAQPERYRVAAVLAWQRAHGLVLPPPPAPRRTAVPPSESALSRTESRARLRATVTRLLCDTVAIGVSHLSPAIHDRLVTAATWAHGVEYHRLALQLRRLADHVVLLLARSALADDLVLLDDVALTHALVCALDASAAAGAEPLGLVGRARTSYDAVRSLDLVGLGGRPWRTASGYHGLTCLFWSPSQQRFLTWTDTRPDTLAGFDPRARWQQPAPWKGLATPATAAGRRLTLTHAQISADGRLSGVESTSAAVTATDSDDFIGILPAVTTWAELGEMRATALSDPRDPAAAWTVLRPTRTAAAGWDAARQTLTWPLIDDNGELLVVEVPWSRLHAHVITRIEALGDRLPDETRVIARVQRSRGQLRGEPLSLVLPDRAINPVDALHFDQGPTRATSPLVNRLLGAGTPDRVDDDPQDRSTTGVPAPLADLRALLEQEAQRGCSAAAAGQVHDRVERAHAALRGVGLTVFTPPDPTLTPAETLLRSHYLLQQVEHTLG